MTCAFPFDTMPSENVLCRAFLQVSDDLQTGYKCLAGCEIGSKFCDCILFRCLLDGSGPGQLEGKGTRDSARVPDSALQRGWSSWPVHLQRMGFHLSSPTEQQKLYSSCAFATFSGNKGIHAIVMFIEFRLWRFIRPPLNRNPGHCLHSLSSWMNHKNGHPGIGIGFHILKSLFASHVLCSQSHLRSLKCRQRYVTSALRAERMPNVDRAICRDRQSLKLPPELKFI